MNKGQIFVFTAPNGEKIKALCLECITINEIGPDKLAGSINICYAQSQSRLFAIKEDGTQYQLISNRVHVEWDHILDISRFFEN